jgi:hypothetical protein
MFSTKKMREMQKKKEAGKAAEARAAEGERKERPSPQ